MKSFEDYLEERYDLWNYRAQRAKKTGGNPDGIEAIKIFQEVSEIREQYKSLFSPSPDISEVEKKFAKSIVDGTVDLSTQAQVIERYKLGDLKPE